MRFTIRFFAWSLVAVTLVATIIVSLVIAQSESGKRDARNSQRAESLQATLGSITSNTSSRARGLANALQDTTGFAQRNEFARLASLVSEEPGISAIGLVLKVPDRQRAAFENRNGYKLKTAKGMPLTGHHTHFVATQAFGRSPTRKIIGTDLASDPVRAAAIKKSIDSALPLATPPVKLLSGGNGTLLYVPIFRKDESIISYPARRRAAVGVLTLGLQSALMSTAITQLLPPGASFRVADQGVPLASAGKLTGELHARKVAFAGREWTIAAQPVPAATIPAWVFILAGGLILTGMLAIVTVVAGRRERYANALVANRTRELEIASTRLAEDARFFELTSEHAWTMDLVGRVLTFNDAWSDSLGWSREELETKSMVKLIHPEDLPLVVGMFERLSHGETVKGSPVRGLAKDGTWRWLEWSAVGAPEFNRIYGSARDITERVELEAEIASERAQMKDAQIIAGLGSWNVNVRTNVMFWSDELYGLLGMTKQEEPLDLSDWLPVVAEEDREAALSVVAKVLENGGNFEFEFKRALAGSRNEEVRLRTRGFAERDSDGRVARIVGTVADITERIRHDEHLQFIANHDVLTGLPNRRHFEPSLAQHLAHCMRYEIEGALMMVDLDGLKQLNDTIGHDAGDEAIKYMADTLRDRLRAADISARLGGDEFAILLPKTTREGAFSVAKSVLSALASPPERLLEIGIDHLTASIGIVMVEDAPIIGSDVLLGIADTEMYTVKRGRRGGASMYDPSKPHLTPVHGTSKQAAA